MKCYCIAKTKIFSYLLSRWGPKLFEQTLDKHTHTHTHTYIYIHTHTHTYIYIYVCVCVCVCMCECVCGWTAFFYSSMVDQIMTHFVFIILLRSFQVSWWVSWFKFGIGGWIYQYCPECFWNFQRPLSGGCLQVTIRH